jgi:hypothetical protein
MFVFRCGIPVAVPTNYGTDLGHCRLVDRLTRSRRYLDAVALLEQHPDSWLVADVLTGAPWAQKFLQTTAQLWGQPATRRDAQRGTRALMQVLAGTRPPHGGRRRQPPLPPDVRAHAAVVMATWRAEVEARWGLLGRPALAQALLTHATGFRPSAAHHRALRALVRRPKLRKRDLVLTLTSWETGVPVRHLRVTPPVAALAYA